jgi:hypothetical protein
LKFIIPLVGLLLGSGAGVGAGLVLAPTPAPETEASEAEASKAPEAKAAEEAPVELVSLNNQFVVPVTDGERVNALVVLSIGLEVTGGQSAAIYSHEAKLRDIFLQVLFEHANMGGFSGAFTNARNLDLLRQSLYDAATQEMGDQIKGILITDLARQDV